MMGSMFSPPLHSQRHQFVIDYVRKSRPRKVADLGCAECQLLKQLRFQPSIELLVGLDLDGAKLRRRMRGLAPLSTDYLQPTFRHLQVALYQGSVTERDARLRGLDLVTSIELIEHLSVADLQLFSAVLFGYMRPASVIVSTPNAEFNRLLPGLTGFRHPDHKFEWNRSEFRSWALGVCCRHGYQVEFSGVGAAPQAQQDSVGFCSQIGVFHRLEGGCGCRAPPDGDADQEFSYSLVYSVSYPSLRDNSTLVRVLLSEVLYWAEQLKNRWMEEQTGRTGSAPSQAGGCLEGAESDVPEDQGGGGEPPSTLHRYLVVPLAALWSCCPKIAELSGSLGNLRWLLMGQPDVKLSLDGSAVLVERPEPDGEQEDSDEDNEAPLNVQSPHVVEPEEDWDGDQ